MRQNLIKVSSSSKKFLIKSTPTKCKEVFPTDLAVADLTVSVNKALSPNESPGLKVAITLSSFEIS